MYDIVIPLKATSKNEELRYSLRSIAKNFPHRNVWVSGYHPRWTRGLNYINSTTVKESKYDKAAKNIRMACLSPKVSDKFFLFNDDFFIMSNVKDFSNMHRGYLDEVIEYYMDNHPVSTYTNAMLRTRDVLDKLGVRDPLSYALHIPMLVDKKLWMKAHAMQLEFNPDNLPIQMRTIYGNLFIDDATYREDVKAFELDTIPEYREYLSTSDKSFRDGLIGKRIRNTFPQKSKYEK